MVSKAKIKIPLSNEVFGAHNLFRASNQHISMEKSLKKPLDKLSNNAYNAVRQKNLKERKNNGKISAKQRQK